MFWKKNLLFPLICHRDRKTACFCADLGRAFITRLKLSQCSLERESSPDKRSALPLLWKLTSGVPCCVFQLGDPRGLHHHTPSTCCQGETVHREHRGAGAGGQRAGQGNTSDCNYHTNVFSTAKKTILSFPLMSQNN